MSNHWQHIRNRRYKLVKDSDEQGIKLVSLKELPEGFDRQADIPMPTLIIHTMEYLFDGYSINDFWSK